jgi:hypothetical protein
VDSSDVEVVSPTTICFEGTTRIAPGNITTVVPASVPERATACNGCADILRAYNLSTHSWTLLRGSELRTWEAVSNK